MQDGLRAPHAALGRVRKLRLVLPPGPRAVHASSCIRTSIHSQGRRELNPQPPVLETGALPIELRPFDAVPHQPTNAYEGRLYADLLRGESTVRPLAGSNPVPSVRWAARGPIPHAQGCAHDFTRLPSHRRHHRVRHAGRGRQGQGPQGRRTAGHRLRRRRARLPDAGPHRRGRDRRLLGPGNHRYTPAGGLPELREAIAAKTLRDSGLAVDGQPGARHQRRQAGRLQRLRQPPRPGRRGAPPRALLDDLPGVDPARRRRPRRRLRPTRRPATGRPSSSSRPPAPTRTKVLVFVSPSNPTGAVYSPAEVKAIGEWAVEHGMWVITDEIYEHLVYGDAEFSSMPVLVPELADRCVVVNGVAKTYAMTGWRVGWMIGPPTSSRRPPTCSRTRPPTWPTWPRRGAGRGERRPLGRGRDARRLRPAPAPCVGHARRDPGRHLPEPRGRVLRLPLVKGLLGRDAAWHADESTASLRACSSTRPRWRSCRARPSAHPATSGCRTQRQTPTSPKGSTASRAFSRKPTSRRLAPRCSQATGTPALQMPSFRLLDVGAVKPSPIIESPATGSASRRAGSHCRAARPWARGGRFRYQNCASGMG